MRIIELLLKHGALINEGDIHGNTPLMNAVLIIRDFSFFKKTEDSLDVRKKIIENINVGQREMIEFLIRNGADIHARDVNGESILHVIAIGTGYPEKIGFAEMMLDNKVDVNAVDDQGLTPLHMVAQKTFNDSSHVKLIQLFEKHGADINAMSPEYGTPLHVAISKNEYDPDEDQVFDYLLAHPDIDINARKASGDTPLHIAADKCVNRQVFSCLEKLLSAGADINLENTVGDPPLHRLCKWLLVNLEDDPEYYEYYGDSLPNEFCLQVSKMIVTHFKKLIMINVHVNEKIREKFNSLIQLRSEEYSAIDIDIEQELNQLKSRMLNQHVSLHGILCEDPNKMFKYANNDHFKKIIDSSSLEKDFPIFHDFLTLQFKRGSIRHSILCKAKSALAILSRVNWPDYCAEYILGCLDDADLRSLIKSSSTIRYSEKSQNNPQQPSIISKKLRCE
ncbi:hypothetical protein QAD02_006311 [Eretmocerus hayati]|uniref:Uncharacterized protein n=1 Tax=Eretmocerus hayati TaxID=131215 RepID=A0ACC2N0W0_9HYME|nr:hypothetical protein QAD02_006311 [Eretmocerus hayati]